jgi:hypothetical protein
MTPTRAWPLKAATVLAILALAGCGGSFGDLFSGSRGGRGPAPPGGPVDGPPATEAGICQLARQAVREATGVRELQGDTCSASHTGPGAWQARVDFAAGARQQSYQVDLQPMRQRQGWAVVSVTPQTPSG